MASIQVFETTVQPDSNHPDDLFQSRCVSLSHYIFSYLHHCAMKINFQIPTLSFSSPGTCLVSLGFGTGDPVFILSSGGTFVSSTTCIGTDNAGCNKKIVKA